MEEISTVGLDIAKSSFQVHAVDAAGEVVVRRQLRRGQVLPFFRRLAPCLIGMEACATSHHWARGLIGLGHEVRLMPPRYVSPMSNAIKVRRSPAGIVPRIGVRLSQQAWTVGERRVGAQLTGVGIALEAFRAVLRPADPEQVGIAIGQAGHETGPGSVAKRDQAVRWIWPPLGPVASRMSVRDDIDIARRRRPHAEDRPVWHECAAHWRVPPDIPVYDRHHGFSRWKFAGWQIDTSFCQT
jgi:transposase